MIIKPKFHTPPSNEAWVYTYIILYIRSYLGVQEKNGHILLPCSSPGPAAPDRDSS